MAIHEDSNISLLETVQNVKSNHANRGLRTGWNFYRDIINVLSQNCPRPIVFPLSNPTEKAEANPHDVLDWTDGKAIVGTGILRSLYMIQALDYDELTKLITHIFSGE